MADLPTNKNANEPFLLSNGNEEGNKTIVNMHVFAFLEDFNTATTSHQNRTYLFL